MNMFWTLLALGAGAYFGWKVKGRVAQKEKIDLHRRTTTTDDIQID